MTRRSADPAPETPGAPQFAASGPRASAHRAEYERLLEMILDGSRLHYADPRSRDDPDLDLLLGDQLYARGLSRLAHLGDLEAVAELADLISMLAAARAAGDDDLADAIWRAGAAAIGWGATEAHERAKAMARAGEPGATEALLAGAERPTS